MSQLKQKRALATVFLLTLCLSMSNTNTDGQEQKENHHDTNVIFKKNIKSGKKRTNQKQHHQC